MCLRKKNDSKEVPKKSIFPRCSSRSLKIFHDRQWSKARVDVSDILILLTPRKCKLIFELMNLMFQHSFV